MRKLYYQIKWNIRNYMMLNEITEDDLYSQYQQTTVVLLFSAVIIYVIVALISFCFKI